MRLPVRLLAGLFFSVAGVQAGPLKENYRLRERGEWRDFVVSREEVHRNRVQQRLPAAARSAEAVRTEVGSDGDMVVYPRDAARDGMTRRLVTRQVAVRLKPGADATAIATLAGCRVVRLVGRQERWAVLQTNGAAGSALDAAEGLARLPGVLAAEPQLARQQQRRFVPNDPLFSRQWYLRNLGQGGGSTGVDLRLTNIWDQFRGAGRIIGIVDDGLAFTHPDLAANYEPALSYDFNYHDANPAPARFDFNDHGTSCAGLAAGCGNNGVGVTGVAFEARLAGLRLIARPTTDADEAEAFAFRSDAIEIKSNSWGPRDNAKTLEGVGPLTRVAMEEAVAEGRGGRGTILVWAGGNGGDLGDNSNYDGFANRSEVVAIGAVDNFGYQAYYSEAGANLVAVAPSSGGSLQVTTVDRAEEDGYNFRGARDEIFDRDYTQLFGGTSAACPLAAGVIALMLQANPQLGWRDVREILIATSRQTPGDADWITNGAGFHFNHKFGAGLVDAQAAVTRAQTWTNLGPRISALREERYGAEIIPDNRPAGVEHVFSFTERELRVEHAAVTVDIRHADRGQLRVELESPSGTKSVLAPGRPRDHGKNLRGWTFTTVRCWGENAAGDWKVRVIDQQRKTAGTLVSLKVELFGSELLPPLVADGIALTAEETVDGQYQTGERVTAGFRLKNNSAAPMTDLQVTLAEEGGIVAPSGAIQIPVLDPGETIVCPFAFTIGLPAGQTLRAALQLTTAGGNPGRVVFRLPAGRRSAEPLRVYGRAFTAIPGTGTSGAASPYPIERPIFPFAPAPGAVPVVTKVTLTLHGFTHQRSQDVDVLLVAQDVGRSVMLMSDAGQGAVRDLELTFADDGAPQILGTPLTSGTWRPRNFAGALDPMPAPAPRQPYGTQLSVFEGIPAAANWQIYLRDDQQQAAGSITGWELLIDYAY